jgi:hypothetical protein
VDHKIISGKYTDMRQLVCTHFYDSWTTDARLWADALYDDGSAYVEYARNELSRKLDVDRFELNIQESMR